MRPVAWLVALGSCLGGVALGIEVGRRWSRSAPHAPAPVRNPASAVVPENAATAALQAMQDEILSLRRQLRRLEKTAASSGAAGLRPDELYRDLADPRLHEDPKRWLAATGRLADLDPSMTPHFVAKYREKKPYGDALALELALGCGGPEVVALLKEIFGDPRTPAAARHVAGVAMTGMGLVSRMWPEYPSDPQLTELASRFVGSSDPADRRAAIGLLRLQPGDASRSQVQFLAAHDSDPLVRAAAVTALGTVGDRSTLLFLRDLAARDAPRLFEDAAEEGLSPPPKGRSSRPSRICRESSRSSEVPDVRGRMLAPAYLTG